MRNDRSWTPFGHCLQRGTTIIRCSPPPAVEESVSGNELHSQYYGSIERRRSLFPSPSTVGRPAVDRQPIKIVSDRRTSSLQHTTAVPVSAEFDICVGAPNLPDPGENLHGANHTLEHCKFPTSADGDDVSGTQSPPDEEPMPSDEEPEPCVQSCPDVRQQSRSPRIKMNWEGEDHCSNFVDCKTERRENDPFRVDAVVRGYIDIAHALLRHFEEAMGAKQRLTKGSLQCAEIVCSALQGIQNANPRLKLLVQRISAAIAMLHKRKLSDERDAAALGLRFEEINSHQLGEAGSVSLPIPSSAPMYTYQHRIFGQRQSRHVFPGGTNGLGGGHLEYPSTPHICTPHDLPYAYKRSPGSLNRQVTAIAARSCNNKEGRVEGTAPAVPTDGLDTWNTGPHKGISVPRRAEQFGLSCSSSKSLNVGTSNVRVHTGVQRGVPDALPSLMQNVKGFSLPCFIVPKVAGGRANACQPNRLVGASMPFGDSEGDRPIRPLVLSETRTLSANGSSEQGSDARGDAVEEALSLIKWATDLIVSGEGPEYVEKRFFRYSRSSDVPLTVPRIPEGMDATQGKYILLRYAIAVIEAECGDSPAATDIKLYLPDLRRMAEILRGSGPRLHDMCSAHDRAEGHTESDGTPQNASGLPERCPEQRMERHLPLTILNLPALGPRLEGVKCAVSPHLSRPIRSDLPRSPSRCELGSPAGMAKRNSGESNCTVSPHLSGPVRSDLPGSPIRREVGSPAVLVKLNSGESNLAKLGDLNITETSVKPPVSNHSLPEPAPELPITEPGPRRSLEASEQLPEIVFLGSPDKSTSLQAAPATEAPLDLGKVERSSYAAFQPTKPAPPSPPSRQPRKMNFVSGFITGGKTNESHSSMAVFPPNEMTSSRVSRKPSIAGMPADGPTPRVNSGGGSGFSPNKLASFRASRIPADTGVEGFKLAASSIIRDPASGTVTSRIFEAPKSPSEPTAIGIATSLALKNVSASRSRPPSLPDVPGSPVGSAFSTGYY